MCLYASLSHKGVRRAGNTAEGALSSQQEGSQVSAQLGLAHLPLLSGLQVGLLTFPRHPDILKSYKVSFFFFHLKCCLQVFPIGYMGFT